MQDFPHVHACIKGLLSHSVMYRLRTNLRTTQIYRTPKRSEYMLHTWNSLHMTSQSLNLNEKLLMMQYIIAVPHHQYTLFVLQVVVHLAII